MDCEVITMDPRAEAICLSVCPLFQFYAFLANVSSWCLARYVLPSER